MCVSIRVLTVVRPFPTQGKRASKSAHMDTSVHVYTKQQRLTQKPRQKPVGKSPPPGGPTASSLDYRDHRGPEDNSTPARSASGQGAHDRGMPHVECVAADDGETPESRGDAETDVVAESPRFASVCSNDQDKDCLTNPHAMREQLSEWSVHAQVEQASQSLAQARRVANGGSSSDASDAAPRRDLSDLSGPAPAQHLKTSKTKKRKPVGEAAGRTSRKAPGSPGTPPGTPPNAYPGCNHTTTSGACLICVVNELFG